MNIIYVVRGRGNLLESIVMLRFLIYIFLTLCGNLCYFQTCFGLLESQLGKIKISKSKRELLSQIIGSSFYRVQAKITYKEVDANVLEFSGEVVSHRGKKEGGNITFKLLHPKGINFQYEITIKEGKFFEQFFTEEKFLPGIYLWEADITLEEWTFTNELFFIMEVKGTKRLILERYDTKKGGDNSISDVEYIFRLDRKHNEELVKSLRDFELKTRGLYYFVYLLRKLIELTNEITYLVKLINKKKQLLVSLRKYVNSSYKEFHRLLKELNLYKNDTLWQNIDNTMPLRLLFLKKYYKVVLESFRKGNIDMEHTGKTFEISTTTIEMLSKILW